MSKIEVTAAQGCAAYKIQLADADGADCGSVSWTVSGEIVLEWGYGGDAKEVFFDPEDIEAIVRALVFVRDNG